LLSRDPSAAADQRFGDDPLVGCAFLVADGSYVNS
jgi:hypothetical protein